MGLAQAQADLTSFETSGQAPRGTVAGRPGQDQYQIYYSAITVNLYNAGDQRTLDVRFPIVMDSAFHRDMDRYAYWTNRGGALARGDLNWDGIVDFRDLAVMGRHHGQTGVPQHLDLSGPRGIPDGTIDWNDHLVLMGNWLTQGPE